MSFGLDPFAAVGARTVSGRLERSGDAPISRARLLCEAMGFGAPVMVADARVVHAAGGSPAQELAFALAAAVSLLRLLEAAGTPLAEARALIAFRLGGRRG